MIIIVLDVNWSAWLANLFEALLSELMICLMWMFENEAINVVILLCKCDSFVLERLVLRMRYMLVLFESLIIMRNLNDDNMANKNPPKNTCIYTWLFKTENSYSICPLDP